MHEDIQLFRDVEWGPALRLALAGRSFCDGTYFIRRSATPLTVLEYVEAGRGTLTVGGTTVRPSAGDFYIIPGGQSHEYRSDARDPWVKCFLNLYGSLPGALLRGYGLEGVILVPGAGEAGRLLAEGIRELPHLEREKLPEYVETLLFRLVRRLAQCRRPASREATDADRIASFLKRQLTVPTPPLARIAAEIGCSPAHAIRLFKRTTGTTPVAYLLNEKLQLARELLGNTGNSVKEVAAAVGFDDPFYFSRCFKRRFGVSPRGIRREGRR